MPRIPALVVASSLALLQDCFLIETPCGRVAGSVCSIPGEESACASIKAIARDNEPAQATCEKIEPIAAAYAKNPSGLLEEGKWMASRAVLAGAGLVGKLAPKDTAEEKLEKAGKKLGKAMDKVGDAAEEAGEAVGGAVDGVKSMLGD